MPDAALPDVLDAGSLQDTYKEVPSSELQFSAVLICLIFGKKLSRHKD